MKVILPSAHVNVMHQGEPSHTGIPRDSWQIKTLAVRILFTTFMLLSETPPNVLKIPSWKYCLKMLLSELFGVRHGVRLVSEYPPWISEYPSGIPSMDIRIPWWYTPSMDIRIPWCYTPSMDIRISWWYTLHGYQNPLVVYPPWISESPGGIPPPWTSESPGGIPSMDIRISWWYTLHGYQNPLVVYPLHEHQNILVVYPLHGHQNPPVVNTPAWTSESPVAYPFHENPQACIRIPWWYTLHGYQNPHVVYPLHGHQNSLVVYPPWISESPGGIPPPWTSESPGGVAPPWISHGHVHDLWLLPAIK